MSMDEIPVKIKSPDCIELKVSLVDRKRIGSFSLTPITKGTEFGPYEGRIVYDKEDESLDPKFSWEVFDLKTFKYLHTVDATNPHQGNWMRYVCCARFFEEQNIVSTQNGSEVYYRALKDIEEGEELLTWFQPKKKKRKRSLVRNSLDTADRNIPDAGSIHHSEGSSIPTHSASKQKRRRKPKVIPDAYDGPLDWEEREPQVKKIKEDIFEPLQPGQKRRRRKKLSSDNIDSEVSSRAASPAEDKQDIEGSEDSIKPDLIKIEGENVLRKRQTEEDRLSKKNKKSLPSVSPVRKNSSSSDTKKETGQTLSIAEINNSVEWEFPPNGEEYNFELKKHHVVTENGKKLYKCDICLGLYKHMFSLKRHYLRNHINYKYLSKSDMTNCLINLAQVKNLMRNKFPETEEANVIKRDQCLDSEVKNEERNERIDDNNDNEPFEKETSEVKSVDELRQNSDQDSAVDSQICKNISPSDTSTESKGETEENRNKSNGQDQGNILNETNESSPNEECNDNEEKNLVDEDTGSSESVLKNSDTTNRDNKDQVEGGDELEKATQIKDEKEKSVSMPGLFRCYTCYLTFDDFESIKDHTQNHPEQTDGACFPCDMCSMRFNYKHNLVRHKKTHELGGGDKKTSEQANEACEKSDGPSPRRHLLPAKNLPPQEKKPLLLPSVFRCGICPLKFDSQSDVKNHVEEEHKTGSKFQCIYCGKDFLSMPNMKKHVRFHLGYRATCRICSEAFSNVGALRKHTRVSHPDIYKAKLIERLEKYGVLKGPDKNALSKEVIEKVNLNKNKLEETKDKKETAEIVKKEVKAEAVTSEKEEEIDNEINFTADEIDDGGSRFKFACTVCKKRFSSYINMCRHRRKVHSNENRHRTEQCLTFGRKPRTNPSPIFENPLEVAAFYANISHNIATNLNCYIDGKPESLKTFVDHVKIEDYQGNFGYSAENEEPVDLTWENYNFPRDYKPVKTISFADIKNVLNIHNDFESHCMSVDTRSTEIVDYSKNLEKEEEYTEQISKPVQDTKSGCITHLTESKDIEESIEDIEVREINSEKSSEVKESEKPFCNSEEVHFDTMGKSSHGQKVLANIGSVLLKKGTGDGNNELKKKDVKGFNKVSGVAINTDSPAAKTFHQVKLGEYANFQDDLLSCDIDSTLSKGTYYAKMAKPDAKMAKAGHVEEHTGEKKNYDVQTTKKLVQRAQGQLEALYDSIDSCESVRKTSKTPKPLSVLCEKVLGLCPLSKEQGTGSSLNVEIASQLKLSTSDSKNQSGKKGIENGPDYSDATEESPFYNYESIVFGKNGNIEQVCGVCKKHFSDLDSLLRHHTKKHPAIACSFLEVEQGHEIEDLHFSEPSYVGALAVTDPGLDNIAEIESFKCTNCSAAFKTISKLHVHLVNCSSIDPIYGVPKTENSPTKTPLKRKLQKKIFSLFGSKNDVKSDLNSTVFKLSQQRNESQSPKRVFTGCRKRTSYILPDSPQKLVSEQRPSLPTVSGYNPQNHVRRRELTEILDTLTCEACGLKFKTIIILERHVKYCTKKEKFKSIQPMACPLIDESLEKIKNMCLYCNKNFTYTKSLLNHFQDFCPVKKAKLDKGELTEHDKLKELEIIERIQKADEEKVLKQKEIESRPKRSMPWQVGRKSKRKGHSWTNIKKRNQQKQCTGGNRNTDGSDGNEDVESSESEGEIEENEFNSCNTDQSNDISEVVESLNDNATGESECHKSVDTECASEETYDKLGNKTHINECEEVHCQPTDLPEKDSMYNENQAVLNTRSLTSEQEEYVAVSTLQEVIPASEITTAVASVQGVTKSAEIETSAAAQQEAIPSNANTSVVCSEQSFSEKDGPVTLYTCVDVNNTSLNCTARYSVNLVNTVKKYRPIAPKPRSSSLMFQCVSKQIPTSKSRTANDKRDSVKDNKTPSEDSCNIKRTDNTVSYSGNQKSSVLETEEEATFKLAEQGLIKGKRKRARVGKVEEFLRNAFKRKRKKENEQEKASGEIQSSIILINPDFSGMNNMVQGLEHNDNSSELSKQFNTDTVNSSQGCENSLKSKQAAENTLNKISQVVLSKMKNMEENHSLENVQVCEMSDLEAVSLNSLDDELEQNVQNGCQMKNELNRSSDESFELPINVIAKRGRGRPRGSSSKKQDKNIVKSVPGRKRGRPRKVQLPDTSTYKNECASPPLIFKTNDLSAGEENDTEADNVAQSPGKVTDNNHTQDSEIEQLSISEICKIDNDPVKKKEENNHTNIPDVISTDNEHDNCSNSRECIENKSNVDGYNGNCNQFHGLDKSELELSNLLKDNTKDSTDAIKTDKKRVDDTSEYDTTCNKDTEIDVHNRQLNNKIFQMDEDVTVFKQTKKIPENIQNMKFEYSYKNNICSKSNSYDEVDGSFIENTTDVLEKAKDFTSDGVIEHTKTNIENVQKYSKTISISEQMAEHCTENIICCVVPPVHDKNASNTESSVDADDNTSKVEELEKEVTSCDCVISDNRYVVVHSNDNTTDKNPEKKEDSCEPSNEENFKQEDVQTEEMTNNIFDVETELESCSSESKTVQSIENDFQLEPVLSPSERVKMNKRSCKKDVDLTSPVWVKRTKLNKGRAEKKLDDIYNVNETAGKTHQKEQKSCEKLDEKSIKSEKELGKMDSNTDSSLVGGRKRKVSEIDNDVMQKLKFSRQEYVACSSKK